MIFFAYNMGRRKYLLTLYFTIVVLDIYTQKSKRKPRFSSNPKQKKLR
jgi:hypothetical protein